MPSVFKWIFTEDPSKNSQRPRAHCSRGGWPTTAKKLPTFIWPYWSYCGELSIEDSLIMKGHQIVMLQVLQGGILCKLHASHQSRKKTKLRACTSVFWRNLNKDIEDMTKSCKICQELQPKKAREPLLQTKVSPRPWHTLETDIFYLDSENTFWLQIITPSTPLSEKFQRATALVNVWLILPNKSWGQTMDTTTKDTTISFQRSMGSIMWQVHPTTLRVMGSSKAKSKLSRRS